MTERHLRIFLAVCAEMNMTRAAETLYMSQPAVSQAVRELETFYGAQLFERLPRKLVITESGQALKRYAQDILRLFDDAMTRLKDDAPAVVRLGAILSAATGLLTGYIDAFHAGWPEATVKVRVCGSARLLELMRMDELDLALIEDTLLPEDMSCEPFYADKLVIVAAPDDPDAGRELPFERLRKRDFLLRETGAGVRDLFDRLMFLRNVHIEPVWESVSTTALVEAAHAGYGISVQPYLLVKRYLDSGYLSEIYAPDLTLTRNLNIVRRSGRPLSPAAKAFMETVLARRSDT